MKYGGVKLRTLIKLLKIWKMVQPYGKMVNTALVGFKIESEQSIWTCPDEFGATISNIGRSVKDFAKPRWS